MAAYRVALAHGAKDTAAIAPDGGDAWAPAKPRPNETLIRALARAHRVEGVAGGRQVPLGR